MEITPIEKFIDGENSRDGRSRTKKILEWRIAKAIDQTWENPRDIAIELFNQFGLSKFDISKKLHVRYRKVERWLKI